jgi:hypothetical protein
VLLYELLLLLLLLRQHWDHSMWHEHLLLLGLLQTQDTELLLLL